MTSENSSELDTLLASLAARECSPSQRLMALAIVGLAGPSATAIPVRTLAARTGFKAPTVRFATRSLEKRGVIEIFRRSGRSRPHIYKMSPIASKNED